MDEYITKDAALACFHDWIDRYGHEHTADEIVEYQRIENLPAEDVRPVVRGEWREISGNCDFQIYECNKCKRTMLNHGIDKPNFCPNCGADMREVKADG